MKGVIPYSKFTIKHIPIIQHEMGFRGVKFDKKWSIRKLAQALMEYCLIIQRTERQKTGESVKDNDLNEKPSYQYLDLLMISILIMMMMCHQIDESVRTNSLVVVVRHGMGQDSSRYSPHQLNSSCGA